MRPLATALAAVVIAAAATAFVAWQWNDSGPTADPTGSRRVAGRVSCGGADSLPTFSPATLQRTGVAASTLFGDAPGKALHAFLSGRPGSSFPLTVDGDFVVISRRSTEVVYLERLADGFATAAATKQHGTWKVRGWGGCAPRFQGSISWQLGVLPNPAATTLTANYITGGKCHGPTHELLPLDHMDVHETADAVEVALYLAEDLPPPGWKPPKDSGCNAMGIPERATVTLKSPLGTRRILDAGAVPPRPVETDPTAYS